jgi:hypothetical protein
MLHFLNPVILGLFLLHQGLFSVLAMRCLSGEFHHRETFLVKNHLLITLLRLPPPSLAVVLASDPA